MADDPQHLDRRPRVILYARVSANQHRDARSVTQQLTIGRRLSVEHGWRIVAEYSDNDRSASRYATRVREDWPKAEADIEAGRADVLWVWEISRGTRDLEVWARLARVCREHRMRIALDDEVWDTTKPAQMRHLNQLMVDAVYESDKTASRVSRDAAANAERGGAHGPWGFGFRHLYDPDTGELLRRVVHEPEADIIREVAARHLSGETLGKIAVDLNDRRIPTSTGLVAGEAAVDDDGNPVINPVTGEPKLQAGWRYQLLVQVLQRAALIGRRESKGRIIESGGWDPIFDGRRVHGIVLDEAAWWTIRDRLESRPRDRDGRRAIRDGAARHLLAGIALCGVCGARMYRATNDRTPGGWAYQCRGLYPGAPKGHVSRSGPALEAAVVTLVVARFCRPDALEAFREPGVGPQEVTRARARKSELEGELRELEREVEAGEVSRRMASADERRIEGELEGLTVMLRPRMVEPLAAALAGPSPVAVAATWQGWTLDQQRAALRTLAERIEVPRVGRGRRGLSPSEQVRITWVGA